MMRLLVVISLALMLAVATAEPQGFFDNVRNFFRPGRRPPPPQNRPPPPQGGNRPPPPQQFNNPPQQPAQRPPQRPPVQGQFGQPQQQQQPQQIRQQPQRPQPSQFVQPRPQETFRRPAVQGNRPPQQFPPVRNQQPAAVVPATAAAAPTPAPVVNVPAPRPAAAAVSDCTPGASLNGCPGACANEVDPQGRRFILTYKVDEAKCSNFTGQEADEYCKLQGGRAVSLDDNDKSLYFINIAIRDRRRYFWTGGRIAHDIGTVTWPSGKREGYIRGQRFWSPTGGKKPEPEPQPDNRDGNEICIGVLNNFYADGVKWHDVSCHHRKPTICEL